MTLTRSNRETLLNKIQRLVQEKFYDPQFNGKDWGAIVEGHREQILASESCEAFEVEVTAMFNELDSSGLGILGEHSKITPRSAINASFQKINTVQAGERWVFQDILPGGVADRAGIRPGDALLSIQGENATSMEKPAFPIGESSIPILISRKGTQKEAQLDLKTPPKYKDNPYAEPESITASMKGKSTGKVKVGLFPGKIGIDFAKRVQQVFTNELKNADRLVVDLRGNPGGGIGGLRLMSYLTPEKQPIGFSLDRAMAEKGYARESLPRFNRIPQSKLELPLLALKFMGKKSVVLETEGLASRSFTERPFCWSTNIRQEPLRW